MNAGFELVRQGRERWLSFLVLATGVFYLVGPVDLDPQSHIDEAAFLILSLALAWLVLPGRGGGRSSWPALAGSGRSVLLHGAGVLGGGVLLRLCLGRWPTQSERSLFARGFAGEASVPPLLRGLHAVPAAKEQLGHVGVMYLQQERVVPPTPVGGTRRMVLPEVVGNPLSYRTGKPIAFLHVEKSAGVAVARTIAETLHPLQMNADPQRTTPPHVRSPFVGEAMDSARRSKLIWGHYDLPSIRRADPDRAVFTLLREPRARILSLYRYWRTVDESLVRGVFDNFNVRAAHDNDLLGFLRVREPLVRDFIDNVYVRRLTGLYATGAERDPLAEDGEAALRRAIEALDTLAYAGTVEQLGDDWDRFGRAIDVALPPSLPRLNDTERRSRSAGGFAPVPVVTPEVEAELEALTRLDRTLYAVVADEVRAACGPRQAGSSARRFA